MRDVRRVVCSGLSVVYGTQRSFSQQQHCYAIHKAVELGNASEYRWLCSVNAPFTKCRCSPQQIFRSYDKLEMDMDIDMDMVMTVLMSDQVLLRLVLACSSLAPKTLNWPSRRYYIDGDSTNVRSVVVDVDDFSSTL